MLFQRACMGAQSVYPKWPVYRRRAASRQQYWGANIADFCKFSMFLRAHEATVWIKCIIKKVTCQSGCCMYAAMLQEGKCGWCAVNIALDIASAIAARSISCLIQP